MHYWPLQKHDNGNWSGAGFWFYHYTGSGSSPTYIRDNNWTIVEKNLSLPGVIQLTIKPTESQTNNQKQYTLPNMQGHTLLTMNAVGTNTSTGNGPANTFTYDPFGNILSGSTFPNNTTTNGSYAWAGSHAKLTETDFALTPISMGARTYIPALGRFTQADPIEGGTPNAYVYPPDPVNMSDYSGMFCLQACITATNFLQPATPHAPLQPATRGVAIQGPGAPRSASRPAPPPTRQSAQTSFLAKVRGGIKSGASTAWNGASSGAIWFGQGLKNAPQKTWNNKYVQSAVIGCGLGAVSDGIMMAAASAGATGQVYVSAGALVAGCAVGASIGISNTVNPGSGDSADSIDMTLDAFDAFMRYAP